jgi:hypothetical protein
MDDLKMQDLMLRALYSQAGREAILLPSMFNPPILLSNIFRLGGVLKKKGYVTVPMRRLGGWHMKLLEPGISYCEAQKTTITTMK